MFICITDSLFCTPETNSNIVNQLYFNNFFLIITTAKVSNNRVFCVPIPHEIFLHFLYQKIIDH